MFATFMTRPFLAGSRRWSVQAVERAGALNGGAFDGMAGVYSNLELF
jgi:hypothetical protein